MQEDEDPDILAKIRSIGTQNLLILGLGLLGLIFLSIGLIQIFNNKPPDIQLTENKDNLASQKNGKTEKIIVDVGGAVLRPGVYSLPTDSRLQDALIAAGGLSGTADRNFVEKNLNLAQKITDGMKIFIPKQGEQLPVSTDISSSVSSGKISVNNATEDALDTLPGIGVVTAQKIIDKRPYLNLEELVSKQAVTQKVLDKIKDKITL